ncbi:27773_t:CDS:2, partial [Gigaspora margarita]
EQINKVYDRLFSKLKSKVQQAKSVMLSIGREYNEYRDEWKFIISCCWLTEDFEFHKILLCVKENIEDIIEVLDKWDLTNLKFIHIVRMDEHFYSDDLIINSLSRWAEENTNINDQENDHEISTIITSIMNAIKNLCGIVNF